MAKLGLSIKVVADVIKHCLWSRRPVRHLELAITLSNYEDAVVKDVSFELLVPEDSIFNLSGDAWNPIEERDVQGTLYVTWQTLGGGMGRYVATIGGMTFRATGSWQQKLTVNIKPYYSTIDVLWRLFESGDPVGDYGKERLTLQPFAPGL